MTSTELVHLEKERGVATLTLDSPQNRNALSAQLRSELWERLQEALNDDAVRVIVLTHTGPVFCAGADLKEARQPGGQKGSTDDFLAVLDALWQSGKPVVARLSGPARAGGLGLMAACDFAVATDSTTFAFTEVRIGVVPAVISVPLQARVIPHALHRYFLTGETFDARRAVEIGLLTAAVSGENLDAEVRRLTDDLILGAPGALARTKELLHASAPSLLESLKTMQAVSKAYFSSSEGQEGVRAFSEKRTPSWIPAG
ncbi:enoyl-CoA hydratase [Pseudarthrobacter sulfonivorans]|uniref:Enoyl-CoA hydratase n=1 Tax=Pseudarthrobacter sulfonivorans TaxID=121292 RepID=A0A0U3QTD6_9MICC|nr:enoyl-CoA hydratase [Pseudarthrobacter sulfonivorans]